MNRNRKKAAAASLATVGMARRFSEYKTVMAAASTSLIIVFRKKRLFM